MGLTKESPASQDKKKSNPSNTRSGYLRYSGLAIQLLAALGLFGWLGHLLDQYLTLRFPVFMLLFGLMAFIGMMVNIYKTISKDQ